MMLDPLESRTLLAGPSPAEQHLLELINRFRTNPTAEMSLLLGVADDDIRNAMDYFNVDTRTLANQWGKLAAVPPLAWNDALARSAADHSQRMLTYDQQSHQLPGEATLTQRLAAAGYANASFVGENIFAYAQSPLHAHAGFAIDWGVGPGGIQDPAGHRANLLAGVYREVGLSVINSRAGKTVGPLLVSQEFGARRNAGNPFLLGVVYNDANRDRFYTPGEGMGGITILASGKAGVFSTLSMTAGGYQMSLPAGTYALTAAGAGGIASLGNVTIGADNVKRDALKASFTPDTSAPVLKFASSFIIMGGQPSANFTINWTDNGAVNAATLGSTNVRITGPNGYSALADLVSLSRRDNGPAITATYRFNAPAGFFDSADNGAYAVSLVDKTVADAAGNFAAGRSLGTLFVSVPQAVLTTNGTLIVNGTPGNDAINVALSGQTLVARVNQASYTIGYGGVRRIFVAGLAGNDTLTMGRAIMGSTLDGGPGNDILYGTDAADTLQGQAGDDILYGYAGNDVFRYSAGRDRIFGGLGTDSATRDTLDLLREVESLTA